MISSTENKYYYTRPTPCRAVLHPEDLNNVPDFLFEGGGGEEVGGEGCPGILQYPGEDWAIMHRQHLTVQKRRGGMSF